MNIKFYQLSKGETQLGEWIMLCDLFSSLAIRYFKLQRNQTKQVWRLWLPLVKKKILQRETSNGRNFSVHYS